MPVSRCVSVCVYVALCLPVWVCVGGCVCLSLLPGVCLCRIIGESVCMGSCTYVTVNIYFNPLLDAETYYKCFLLMGGWFKRYFVWLVGTLPVIRLNFFRGLSLLINIDAHISKEFPKKIL